MIYDQNNIKHPIVKALLEKGWTEFMVAYSRCHDDNGWTIINTSVKDKKIFGEWLGFTIYDALKEISCDHHKDFWIKN